MNMSVSVRTLEADGRFSQPSAATIEPAWRTDSAIRWIHIAGESREQTGQLLAPLELHPIIHETLNEEPTTPAAATFGNAVFIRTPQSANSRDGRAPMLTLICMPSLLITVAARESTVVTNVALTMTAENSLTKRSVAGMVYKFFDELVRLNGPHFLKLRSLVDNAAKTIDDDKDMNDAEDLRVIQDQVTLFEDFIEDTLYCTTFLNSLETSPLVIEPLRPYFRDLINTIVLAQTAVKRQAERVRDLQQYLALAADQRTSKRLKLLTILSAAYLPATLMVGCYGMNFDDIPVTTLPHGYFVVMGMIGLIIAGQFLYFYLSGWFR